MKVWPLFSLSEVQRAYNDTVKSLWQQISAWKCENLKVPLFMHSSMMTRVDVVVDTPATQMNQLTN